MAKPPAKIKQELPISPPITPPLNQRVLKLSQAKQIRDYARSAEFPSINDISAWCSAEFGATPGLRHIRQCTSPNMSFLDIFPLDGKYGELETAEQLRYALTDDTLVANLSLSQGWSYTRHQLHVKARTLWDRIEIYTAHKPHFGRVWLEALRRKFEQSTGHVLQMQDDQGADVRNAQSHGDIVGTTQDRPGQNTTRSTGVLAPGVREALARDDAAQALLAIKAKSQGNIEQTAAGIHPSNNDIARDHAATKQSSSTTATTNNTSSRPRMAAIANPSEVPKQPKSPNVETQLQQQSAPTVPSRHTPEPMTRKSIVRCGNTSQWLRQSAQAAAKSELVASQKSTRSDEDSTEPSAITPQESLSESTCAAKELDDSTSNRRPGQLRRTNHLPSVELLTGSPSSMGDVKIKQERRDSANAMSDVVTIKQEPIDSHESLVVITEPSERDETIYEEIDEVFDAARCNVDAEPGHASDVQSEKEAASEPVVIPRGERTKENVPVEAMHDEQSVTTLNEQVKAKSDECIDSIVTVKPSRKTKATVKHTPHDHKPDHVETPEAKVEDPKDVAKLRDTAQSCYMSISENVKQRGQKRRASTTQLTCASTSKKASVSPKAQVPDSDDEPLMSCKRTNVASPKTTTQKSAIVKLNVPVYRTTKVALATKHKESIGSTDVDFQTEVTAQVLDTIQVAKRPEHNVQTVTTAQSDVGVQVGGSQPVNSATQTSSPKHVDRNSHCVGPTYDGVATQTTESVPCQPSEFSDAVQGMESLSAKQLVCRIESIKRSMETLSSYLATLYNEHESLVTDSLTTAASHTQPRGPLKRKQDHESGHLNRPATPKHDRPSKKRRCVPHFAYSIRVRRSDGTLVKQAVCCLDKRRYRSK